MVGGIFCAAEGVGGGGGGNTPPSFCFATAGLFIIVTSSYTPNWFIY